VIVNSTEWQRANRDYLMHELNRVQQTIKLRVGLNPEEASISPLPSLTPPSALEQLCQAFKLSAFERDLLLLCAGVDLDSNFASLLGTVQQNSQKQYPTFSLALATLENADWQALIPNAPLRKWRLIEIGAGNSLTNSTLRIDEKVLHYLGGVSHLDERLANMGVTVIKQEMLVQTHMQIAAEMVNIWCLASQENEMLPILQLCGQDVASMRAIAAITCDKIDHTPYSITVELLPSDVSNLNTIKSLWEREFTLNNAALVLECDSQDVLDIKQQAAITEFIETIRAPVIIISNERRRQKHRSLITFDVASPTVEEQRLLWQNTLDSDFKDEHIDTLVSHFNLGAASIRAVCLKLRGKTEESFSTLWDVCRTQARPRLDELASRMESNARWDDLVLPEREKQVLHDAASHIRQRMKVYEQWGFGGKTKRGLGISALFAGASGTGKTMAADVLAKELQLDLYRIDLSAVVSKYIGETEKNLARVFDAAEMGGVILLFDEADALFGKRSEVKDSHDRHANMEVAYLLQRMESYPGLSILTTNLKNSIDQAFLRRIRFIVQFPFPDLNQRAELWRKVFPVQTPTEGLDEWKLAKLSVAGGNIRNIALNAAFIAAEADQPVRMEHILQAAKNEYAKMERPLTDIEVKDWV
jgi:SpoVK/Ycf46/Vps4 family AAA+-type ATPase